MFWRRLVRRSGALAPRGALGRPAGIGGLLGLALRPRSRRSQAGSRQRAAAPHSEVRGPPTFFTPTILRCWAFVLKRQRPASLLLSSPSSLLLSSCLCSSSSLSSSALVTAQHTPHTFRGPIGSSTEGPRDCVRMRPPHIFRHTPHAFRGPIGSSTEGPSGCVRMHPSHDLWPDLEIHRRPQWRCSHAVPSSP